MPVDQSRATIQDEVSKMTIIDKIKEVFEKTKTSMTPQQICNKAIEMGISLDFPKNTTIISYLSGYTKVFKLVKSRPERLYYLNDTLVPVSFIPKRQREKENDFNIKIKTSESEHPEISKFIKHIKVKIDSIKGDPDWFNKRAGYDDSLSDFLGAVPNKTRYWDAYYPKDSAKKRIYIEFKRGTTPKCDLVRYCELLFPELLQAEETRTKAITASKKEILTLFFIKKGKTCSNVYAVLMPDLMELFRQCSLSRSIPLADISPSLLDLASKYPPAKKKWGTRINCELNMYKSDFSNFKPAFEIL